MHPKYGSIFSKIMSNYAIFNLFLKKIKIFFTLLSIKISMFYPLTKFILL